MKQNTSTEEIKTFLDAAKNTRYYELFYIILNTGMRIGEITALCWSDIDFECHRIRVYKTLIDDDLILMKEKIVRKTRVS